MTVAQLTYLVAIEDYLSIGEAAKRRKVSQPSITMSIRKLEKELKTQLLDRQTYPVILTDTGKLVAAQARIILKEVDLVGDIVKNAKKGVSGPSRAPMVTKDAELEKRLKKAQGDVGKALSGLSNLTKELTGSLEAISDSLGAISRKK